GSGNCVAPEGLKDSSPTCRVATAPSRTLNSAADCSPSAVSAAPEASTRAARPKGSSFIPVPARRSTTSVYLPLSAPSIERNSRLSKLESLVTSLVPLRTRVRLKLASEADSTNLSEPSSPSPPAPLRDTWRYQVRAASTWAPALSEPSFIVNEPL